MKIVQMHQTVAAHDAIGNDIECMYNIIKRYVPTTVFAENQLNSHVEYCTAQELEKILQDENNIVIYHHSIWWQNGEKFLEKAKAKIVFRYHNITPESFFAPYNEAAEMQCAKGRKQTKEYIEKFKTAIWLVDSYYNAEDLEGVEEENMILSPPFNKIEQWANGEIKEEILKNLLETKEINLLFVGRVAPNKGHLFLLEVMRVYCTNYGKNIKLRIIGKFDDGLLKYNEEIKNAIAKYKLQDCVEFIGEINDSILTSYYLGSDFFLCASEHEGFCVPLIEAQYFGLPVIAKDSSAVGETLGKNQIILGEDSREYAAAIHCLYKEQEKYTFIREYGKRNFEERFTRKQLEKEFLTVLEKLGVEV